MKLPSDSEMISFSFPVVLAILFLLLALDPEGGEQNLEASQLLTISSPESPYYYTHFQYDTFWMWAILHRLKGLNDCPP